jgi:hypothetical protein
MTLNSVVLRVTACSCFTVILVFCSYVSLHRGLASLYAYPGKSTLALWQDGKRHLRQQDWNMVRNSLERALPYDRHNPDLLHDLGAVYDAEVAYYTPGDDAAAKNRTMARQYYLAALAGRPTWPHDWIVLALVKYRLGQIDAEFYQALRRAMALGPWEPSLKLVVADIGLHHWEKFDHAMRELVAGIIRDAVNKRDTAMDMLNLLRRYDRLDMVCNDDVADESVRNYCKQHHRP